MNSLSKFEELSPGYGYPSLKDYFQNESYNEKDKIIKYLSNGKSVLASPEIHKDIVTGAKIPLKLEIMTDGKYTWSTEIIYYVDKYNLRLKKEFEEYVLNQ